MINCLILTNKLDFDNYPLVTVLLLRKSIDEEKSDESMDAIVNAKNRGIEKQRLEQKLKELLKEAKSENTRKAYKSDFKNFKAWCHRNGLNALPADSETVSYFLADNADKYSVNTLQRHLASISTIHKLAGYESPTQDEMVRQAMEGIKRSNKLVENQKKPLLTKHLKLIAKNISDTIKGKRDKAVLLLGFAGGFRRSELVNLDVSDIELQEQGLKVKLTSSKTDQSGKGMVKGIAYGSSQLTCPVIALKEWTKVAGIKNGPLFRSVDRHGNVSNDRLSSKAVALIVKNKIQEIGLNPDQYSGHSLRAGIVTQAALNDVSILSIMDQTGHRSERTVKEYYRNANIFENNASSKLGL